MIVYILQNFKNNMIIKRKIFYSTYIYKPAFPVPTYTNLLLYEK
jgi:hypothetical protein